LGKAYYEEKKDKLAEDQYAAAKQLDPKDPTPFFYEAIQKQTTNRPVEALQDLQTAIELNDNRAVYRSKLLLDQDLAARSAGLARIYTDLGFQHLALAEGYKSVNTDPANFSAHRFLADSYSVLPRHEIARVSELLQSQLLQPLNMTPIQPRLAESNLFLISALGPGTLSFNEFNPIFNRNGVTFQASGLVGENNTWAGEGVLSGIYNRASFSAGYSHFETDGWRNNADQKDDIANAFAQFELSPQTSIQGEYRYRKSQFGDLRIRFFPEDFFPAQRIDEERQSFRLGLKQAFAPNSILLGSFIFNKVDYTLNDNQPVSDVSTSYAIKNPETAFSGEVQHLFRSEYFSLTSGMGYNQIDGDMETNLRTVLPSPYDLIQSKISTDISHLNLYIYSNITPFKNLVITLGASEDMVNGDKPNFEDKSQFNPKLGITWNPLPNTTLRGALFRVLKRTLTNNQTIEPTQVAGFNQFYDDVNGTGAWRYGLAADQKFSKCIFGGIELSRRDLEVPYLDYATDPENPSYKEVNWQESLARAYLFWTPHPWLAFRAEYQFEKIERDEKLTDGPKRLDTHRFPLGVSFFHPSGLGAAVKATYYQQDGEFSGFRDESFHSGSDSFWVVDAGLMYRLPKRFGLITIGVTNLFDQNFKYFDIDPYNSSIQPKRTIFGRITLAFP
jgi:tetratricopeptide (TPR) repeat protein